MLIFLYLCFLLLFHSIFFHLNILLQILFYREQTLFLFHFLIHFQILLHILIHHKNHILFPFHFFFHLNIHLQILIHHYYNIIFLYHFFHHLNIRLRILDYHHHYKFSQILFLLSIHKLYYHWNQIFSHSNIFHLIFQFHTFLFFL